MNSKDVKKMYFINFDLKMSFIHIQDVAMPCQNIQRTSFLNINYNLH